MAHMIQILLIIIGICSVSKNWYLVVAVAIACSIPIYHSLNICQILYGIFSEPSVTSAIIGGLLILRNLFAVDLPFDRHIKYFMLIVVVLSILLYLSVCGVINYDIYGLGYNITIDKLLCLLIILGLVWYYNPIYSLVWFIAIIAFACNMQNSHNLWDYLFDPILAIASMFKLTRVMLARLA
jgi:hypothetical protein